MEKDKFKEVQGWLHAQKVRAALLAECPDVERVDRFVQRLEGVLATDPVTLAAAHHSFREMIRVLKQFVKLDLSFETGIMFRGSRNVSQRGVHTFIAYVTKLGTMELVNRNPNIEVYQPQLVRAGDVFDYTYETKNNEFVLSVTFQPAHTKEHREIECGFVVYRVFNPKRNSWKLDILVLSRERIEGAIAASKNPQLYQKYEDQMIRNIVVRALRGVLPLFSLESMGILDSDYEAPAEEPASEDPSSPQEAAPAEEPHPPEAPAPKPKAAPKKKAPAPAPQPAPAPAPTPPPPEAPVEDPFGE